MDERTGEERAEGGHRAPPTTQGEVPAPERSAGGGVVEGYNTAAETVGFMPSLRWKDNLFQVVFILVVTGVCALVGYLAPVSGWLGGGAPRYFGAIALGIAGLLLSTLFSGLVLMVLGWVRVATRGRRKG